MFYTKVKLAFADNTTLISELPKEIYARCPKCGAEMKFDIRDYGKLVDREEILCDTCERKQR